MPTTRMPGKSYSLFFVLWLAACMMVHAAHLESSRAAVVALSWLGALVPAAQADDGCDSVLRAVPARDLSGPCYNTRNWPNPHGGIFHRIWYPAHWDDDAGRLQRVDTMVEAIERSLDYYARLGTVHSIYAIFSLGRDADYSETGAATVSYSNTHCRIVAFEPALEMSRAHMQQLIAHELFHCFEAWNAQAQYELDSRRAGVVAWWVEGMAEYFGSAVYPRSNLERDWVAGFDAASATHSLLQMSYENVVFFQYMANRWGDAAIIDLMQSLPTSGTRADQAAALAAFRDMDGFFHAFAQAYMQGEIRDGSGTWLPLNPDPGQVLRLPETARLGTRPFVIRRARLDFAATGSHDLNTEEDGARGRYSAREVGADEWDELPDEIEGSDCEQSAQSWQLVLTAVGGGDERRVLSVTAERRENPSGADDCEEEQETGTGSCTIAFDADTFFGPGQPQPLLLDPGDSCVEQCYCSHPEMHEQREVTLEECKKYVRNGEEMVERYLYGTTTRVRMSRCQWRLSDDYRRGFPASGRDYVVSAPGALLQWCTRDCYDLPW